MQPDHRHRARDVADRGFTAVVCHGSACGRRHGDAVVTGLRECVRRHPHGVLVSGGCLLGPLGCHALSTSGTRPAGSLLLVQPCSRDRNPVGPSLWIGPLATQDDIAAVCHWLDTGDLSTIALPAHLRFRARLAGRGATN